ncbi:hypothetical protein CCACVL1_24088 [Corchorus capsularis]|uniref:Serine-threonine/tyrosine-protein kinase catalytic domain-containing protein n=1 Tax=Corchorus capsularis TaxID=210143 RepID=A0A1R3GQX7_COCAP|nr:hypothetical protein CCACVL1_24088 [Corchorus capsularis]
MNLQKPQSKTDSLNLTVYSPEDLRAFTDNFSENNLIGKTQFGQVYRGKIEETGKEPRSVTIKTWNDRAEHYMYHDDRKVLLEDFIPLIFDFGLMSGGIIGKKSLAKENTPMTPGYCDMYGCNSGFWTRWSDVYSYAVILIELIAKRIVDMEDYCRGCKFTDLWALESVKSGKLPLELVHPSLIEDQDYDASDALLLAELGMSCIEFYPRKRPKMKQIVKRLVELSIVKEQLLLF